MKYKYTDRLRALALCVGLVPVLASAQARIVVETQPVHSFDDALNINLQVIPSNTTDNVTGDLWLYLQGQDKIKLYVTPQGICAESSADCTVAPLLPNKTITEEILDIDQLLSADNDTGIPLSADFEGRYSIHAAYTQPGATLSDGALLSVIGSAYFEVADQPARRPNLVIFLADDLGYNDISPFGGEVDTPTIDTLAATGTLLTNFHSHASCSPTRSITLSGVDNHRNGLGTMDGKLLDARLGNSQNQFAYREDMPDDVIEVDRELDINGNVNNPAASPENITAGKYGFKNIGRKGYEGHLNQDVITIATVLRDANYHTYMIGKWHLGEAEGFRPYYRGFEKTFALLEGAGSNFDHIGFSPNFPYTHYTKQGKVVELPSAIKVAATRAAADALVGYADKYQVSDSFYSTRDYTDFMINKINADRQIDQQRKPFFAYFAYQAPHAPLQAPEDLIEKYLPIYSQGWDVVRKQRFDKMTELGIIPPSLEYPERWTHTKANGDFVAPAWDDLNDNERAVYAKKMAIYTGMIEYMDYNMQRFMDYLKNIGEFDNTVFLFFGDNGADDQDRDTTPVYLKWYKDSADTLGITNCTLDDLESSEDITQKACYAGMGLPKSLLTMHPAWAQATVSPFYAAKATMAEGGLRAAAVISGLDIQKGAKSGAFMSALDVFPTFLDYAHVAHPASKTSIPGSLVRHTDTQRNPSFEYSSDTPNLRFVYPLDGRSFRSVLNGTADKAYGDRDAIGFELYGTINRAIYMGDWKILKVGDAPWGAGEKQQWSFFNLKEDPRESVDLKADFPDDFTDFFIRPLDLGEGFTNYLTEKGIDPASDLAVRMNAYADMIQKYAVYATNVRYIPNVSDQRNQRSDNEE
ncbi:MAG: sulfatase-like hydrolase/transferase [Thiotrichaceae bacterium]|nr:sulfatase-like hydrolase/transferase [Thiotrichaceae bacterium]